MSGMEAMGLKEDDAPAAAAAADEPAEGDAAAQPRNSSSSKRQLRLEHGTGDDSSMTTAVSQCTEKD